MWLSQFSSVVLGCRSGQNRFGESRDIVLHCTAPDRCGLLADCDPLPAEQLNGIITGASQKEGVSFELIKAVLEEESAARPCAISFRGAEGLMQLMPVTAEQLNVQDPFDPKQNIEGGAKLLKMLLSKYENNLTLALSAYNAGRAEWIRRAASLRYQKR